MKWSLERVDGVKARSRYVVVEEDKVGPKLNPESSIMGDWSTILLGMSYEGGGGSWARVISSSCVIGAMGGSPTGDKSTASGAVGRMEMGLGSSNVWVKLSIGSESESCLGAETGEACGDPVDMCESD